MHRAVYWIGGVQPGRLGIMPRPIGWESLQSEIRTLRLDGVGLLISLLTRQEVEELGLEREADLCRTENISFISFPISERWVPEEIEPFRELVLRVKKEVASGENVAIHCHGGIGRSAVLAACVLMDRNVSAERAFYRIAQARGCSVPDTQEQRDWVTTFSPLTDDSAESTT